MKKPHTKTVNQTFSIPREIVHELHVYVKRREMSRFVSEAIRKELEAKREELKQAYIAMSKDKDQNTVIKEWEGTVADGVEEW